MTFKIAKIPQVNTQANFATMTKSFAILLLSCFASTLVASSAVVSDLALMARVTNNNAVAALKSQTSPKEPLENKYRRPPRNVVMKESNSPSARTVVGENGQIPPESPPLSLWRVQLLLGFLILVMTIALVVAAVNTARVFGILTDSSQEDIQVAVTSKRVAAHEGDRDPESLTNLLTSHTMRGYGSMFSSALSGLVSPRRPQAARSSNPDDQIIIQ